MKSSIIIALVLSSLLQNTTHFRVSDVDVDSVDRQTGIVSFVDNEGEVWEAEVDRTSEYSVGEKCVLVFDNMGTENIYDDEIVVIAEVEVFHAES